MGAGGPRRHDDSERVSRVTILLHLEPGNRGIRRHNKAADPVLCTYQGCYVSAGADEPAEFFHGHRALGLGRTFGERAGACRNSLGCVFRDIELASISDYLGPVDMRVIRHDRREPQRGVTVSDCRLESGRLGCRRGIHAASYVMWVVPEELAAKAGPEALEQAVEEGLVEQERIGLASPPRTGYRPLR